MRSRLVLVVVVMVLAIGLLWLVRQRLRPVPLPPRAITPAPAVRVPVPSPTSSATAGPEPPPQQHSTVILPWESEPTPSPTAPEEEPTPRPGPSPTPEVSECVAATYSAGVHPGTLAGILVDIRLENRCGRDLGPLDVWLWVGGYRQGDLVQTVRGHPFNPIQRDGEGTATIVLPGSIDWYDRIEVRVIAPGTP